MTIRPEGRSPYETWVLTLRAWSADPRTPLDHLPTLTVETFTPATYQRLIDHLVRALRAVTERWEQALQQLTAVARGDHELAAGLVDLRHTLARRVQLVSHPGLPAEIRDALTQENRADIERFQREFEEALGRMAGAGHVLRPEFDRMLAIIRENSFTAVLDRDMHFDGSALRGQAAPPATPPVNPASLPIPPAGADQAPIMPRRSYRRVTLPGLTDRSD